MRLISILLPVLLAIKTTAFTPGKCAIYFSDVEKTFSESQEACRNMNRTLMDLKLLASAQVEDVLGLYLAQRKRYHRSEHTYFWGEVRSRHILTQDRTALAVDGTTSSYAHYICWDGCFPRASDEVEQEEVPSSKDVT